MLNSHGGVLCMRCLMITVYSRFAVGAIHESPAGHS